MKWFYVIATLLVVGLTLSPFALLDAGKTKQYEGKVVGYNIYSSKIKSMDPATCGDTTSAGVQGNIYEGLYTYHYLKRPLEVVSQLAADMPEISADGLTYTIRIRKGVKYHRNPCFGIGPDGRPKTRTLRTEDFVLAFKRIGDSHLITPLALAFIEDRLVGIKAYRDRTKTYAKGDFSRYDKEDLPGVQAVDEHTLRFKLVKPFPQLLYVLAMHVYAPIPREVIDYHLGTKAARDRKRVPIPLSQRDPEIREEEQAVGTGPYMITDWVRGARYVLKRNPDFHVETYPAEGGPGDREAGLLDDAGKRVPFVDVYDITFVKEDTTAWMMFLSRQRDSSGIPRDVYSAVITGPSKELADKWRKQSIRLVKDTYPAIYWFVFNMDDRVFGASKSLRQALCLSFNVEQYIDVMYNGRGRRALNVVPNTFKGHAEGGPCPYARVDLDLAKKKLAQAKGELVAAGVLKEGEDIPPLTLDLPGTDDYFRRIAEYAQGEFRKIGIRLKAEMNDWPTLQKKVHNKQCQMYTMGWHADYPDAENFLQLYYSGNIERGTNDSNYSNPEFDRLFEQAATIMDVDRRVPLYAKMIKILNEDCPVMLLSEPITYVLLHPWVHNSKLHPVGYGHAKYIRLDTDLRRRLGGR